MSFFNRGTQTVDLVPVVNVAIESAMLFSSNSNVVKWEETNRKSRPLRTTVSEYTCARKKEWNGMPKW